ncbi:MAG: ribosome silencing factor [Flavobacteriaceae bacterium]|nr:ribosome silencing factor [Flavobacteriaceae bacterium]
MLNNNDNASSLIDEIIKGIENVKGEEIQVMDLNNIENTPCKYFIICSGNSNTQVMAIVNSIIKKVSKKIQEKPLHTEGLEAAEWVLIDYINVVVHVFQRKTREFYNIEELWGDAKSTLITSNY